MNWIESIHDRYVYGRRVEQLSECLARLIPPDASVLDIGSGDGRVCSLVAAKRPDAQLTAVDTLARGKLFFPVTVYDGRRLPFDDGSFDGAMYVDVLHHADPLEPLLEEGLRVARRFVLIKDHLCRGAFDRAILRYMDDVGNEHFGVQSVYNYKSRKEWESLFRALNLTVKQWVGRLSLYPAVIGWVFERGLHFVARVEKPPSAAQVIDSRRQRAGLILGRNQSIADDCVGGKPKAEGRSEQKRKARGASKSGRLGWDRS
jgi:SAM-dependent methyltransferase